MQPSDLTKASGGLRGRVLLGWMARDQATEFLLQECLFDSPITAREAQRIWPKCRKRVEALPERKILAAHVSEDRPARRKSAGDTDFFPLASRPAFFSDFFADGLFMEVTLRQKRFELQIESRIITRYGENAASRP
jgi:hypothetical protein